MKLNNLTPDKFCCIGGIGCPSVYSTDTGSLILVGKRLNPDDPTFRGIVRKSPDEEIIEIPAGLLAKLHRD